MKDGFVTEQELKEWIKYTQKKYISDDIDRQWIAINPEKKEKLDWDSYKKITYSFMDGNIFAFVQLYSLF